jgi:hypothetical protein
VNLRAHLKVSAFQGRRLQLTDVLCLYPVLQYSTFQDIEIHGKISCALLEEAKPDIIILDDVKRLFITRCLTSPLSCPDLVDLELSIVPVYQHRDEFVLEMFRDWTFPKLETLTLRYMCRIYDPEQTSQKVNIDFEFLFKRHLTNYHFQIFSPVNKLNKRVANHVGRRFPSLKRLSVHHSLLHEQAIPHFVYALRQWTSNHLTLTFKNCVNQRGHQILDLVDINVDELLYYLREGHFGHSRYIIGGRRNPYNYPPIENVYFILSSY